MKVKHTCKDCGSTKKPIQALTQTKKDKQECLSLMHEWNEDLYDTTPEYRLNFIPVTKYTPSVALTPPIHVHPCSHCKRGEQSAGPGGCPFGEICVPYKRFQIYKLSLLAPTGSKAIKDFECAVPSVSYHQQPPKRRRARAASAGAASSTPQKTSSAKGRSASSQSTVKSKSKWQASSKKQSSPKSPR